MVNKLFAHSKKIFDSKQTSILSASITIMAMLLVSSLLGLVRNRVWSGFFSPSELSLVFAAFRLPDFVFGTLAFGAFSSAFIPVFTRILRRDHNEAWRTASSIVTIGLIGFLIISLIFFMFSESFYGLILPGYSSEDIVLVASIARLLFLSQGLFIVSYVLSGTLESLQRFFIPSLAPVFYNIGIILGTSIFYPYFGIYSPAIGMIIGAFLHFGIQFPLAYKLGFRFRFKPQINSDVVAIGKLTAPRLLDLGMAQVLETVQLSLASLISKASYTYLIFANALSIYPVSLFGTSLAKAAMPILTRLEDRPHDFKRIILTVFNQILFLILPIVTIFVILRIPLIRLTLGTSNYDWAATIETGWVLTAFAISIPFQALITLFNRGFYALHDTKTPVTISIIADVITIVLDLIFVLKFHMPISFVAFSFSLGIIFQLIFLYIYLFRKLKIKISVLDFKSLWKPIVASFVSGSFMFFMIKFFDRSVWVKRLSFIGGSQTLQNLPFQTFVLDTRYTFNLIILSFFVVLVGISIYLLLSYIFRTKELFDIVRSLRGRFESILIKIKTQEPISQPSDDI